MVRLPLALACLAAVAGAWGQARPHNFDLLDVKWSVSLDEPNASLTGDVTNTIRANAGATAITLDFGSLTVDSVTVNGQKATFSHVAPVLKVTLPKAADGTSEQAIRILYHGKPQSGAYFVPGKRAYPGKTPVVYTQGEMVDNRFWLPTWDWPDDKATSEGIIDVPEGWFALSNGKLVDQKTANGRTKFHWKMDQEHVTYLISFSAGPFDENKEEWDGIPVNSYVPKGLGEWGGATFNGTADIVKFYSELTGFRYPYAKYTQSAVPDFMFGGMENITCTTQTLSAVRPASVGRLRDPMGLIAHELAHQWFGDTVTCSGWSDAWINEGWATFLPAFYVRKTRGQDAFDLDRYGIFQGGLGAHASRPDRGVVYTGYKDPLDMFDGFIYPGGASRMFMLMKMVGEEKFWAATKAYLEERKFTSFDTPAFFDSYSRHLGMDLKPFMRQWFYTAGAPNLKVTRDAGMLTVEQTKPYFELSVPVWTLSNGTWTKKQMEISGEKSTLNVGTDPVLVDPECYLMANIDSQVAHTPDQLMDLFLAAPNAGEQARIMDTMLSGLSADQSLRLAKAIKAPEVRRRYLGQLQDGAQSYLLELSRSGDVETVDTAVNVLGGLPKTDESMARIKELAEGGTDNDVLRQSAYRIYLRWTNSMGLIEKAWSMEGYADGYRQMALDAWQQSSPDIARERALEAIEKGLPEPTRQHAIRMLGGLKDKAGQRRVYNALVGVLKENSFGARNAAINSLAQYGDKAALPLIKPFVNHELVFFRQTAKNAVASLGG